MTSNQEGSLEGTPVPDQVRNFVGGEWTTPSGGEQPLVNPATGKEMLSVPFASESEVDEAVRTADEAIEMVNSTEYGNASSIYTVSGSDARQYRYEVDEGNIGVCAPMGFFHFGGRKSSFFGDLHAQGEDAVNFYTDKTIKIERWYN